MSDPFSADLERRVEWYVEKQASLRDIIALLYLALLQEFYGLLLAHFAIRGFMNEAAISADVDSDSLSFTHALHVVRRKIQNGSFSPSGGNGVRDHQ